MLVDALDAATLRFLEAHEARIHALPGRELRDLGDALLLFDRLDREPFWNRLVALRWPAERRAFERRLDEAIVLFGTLDRVPHVWPRPKLNEPPDLIERLLGAGFVDVGGGHVMVLEDASRLREPTSPGDAVAGTSVERLTRVGGAAADRAAADIALVLAEAFAVETGRRASLEAETLAALGQPVVDAFLVRVAGEPAAAAKVTTFDGASYLSSIGTRPSFRGRGLGRLVTTAASRAALERGSRLVYLGVYDGNLPALAIYRRLGYVSLGVVPDLVLAPASPRR